jgi:glutathionylspermidine synthase
MWAKVEKTGSLAVYRRAREAFFSGRGAKWPNTLYDAFDILAPRVLTRAEAAEIFEAAAGVARIYRLAAELLRRLPDEALVEMGVPDYVLPAARCTLPELTDQVIGRLDLAHTDGGYKLLEYNADAPGLLVEAFPVNRAVCAEAGAYNPNADYEGLLTRVLADAVRAGFQHVGKHHGDGEQGTVVVAASGRSRRDMGQAAYVCELLTEFRARFVPIETLAIGTDGLYDQHGKRIDVLYRVFPLQSIGDAVFRQSVMPPLSEMGGAVLRFVKEGRLALINPPSAFLLASKALQVIIWNLFEAGQYFGEVDRRLIERLMLPTYLDPLVDAKAYVVKPVYGAEGDSVKILSRNGGVLNKGRVNTHLGQPMVYQKHVEIPAEEMMTEYGPRMLHVVTSCFVIGGVPGGIVMRAGEAITDEAAWVLPVCIRDCGFRKLRSD